MELQSIKQRFGIIGNDEKLNRVLDVLALVIYNSDRLFVFDSIVFAGSFLSSQQWVNAGAALSCPTIAQDKAMSFLPS